MKKREPGCPGLCKMAMAKRIGGKFGAWLIGTLVPVTFGLRASLEHFVAAEASWLGRSCNMNQSRLRLVG